jgi:8-amino-3,8-dideoxy-alpha-D-manno-octulosonate transaminase
MAASPDDPKLAIDGGKPVRATELHSEFPGTQFYGREEQAELMQAYETKSLFRFYGPVVPTKVAKFEQEFAASMGVKHVLALTSGTASLHCGLTVLGAGPGDEVILPAWAWHSCYMAILMTGALPVFAEIDESFNLDPDDVAKKITPQTKVIMPVHLTGVSTDMDRLMPLARKHGLRVIEDACQSTGARFKGKRLGTIGDLGAYSFQVHKTITSGEGGAVVTNDLGLFERAIRFHDLGKVREYHEEMLGKLGGTRMPYSIGINYRMTEMAGALMRAQLPRLDDIIKRQRRVAWYVKDRIRELPGLKLRKSYDPDGETGWTIDVMLPTTALRDRFMAAMSAENVPMLSPSASTFLPALPYIVEKAAPHPNWPTFQTPRGKQIRYGASMFPKSQDIWSRSAILTIGPKYTESDAKDIVEAFRKVQRTVLPS